MNQEILSKIKEIKKKYETEGFIIIGIFGSYARGEETSRSDLDILYDLTEAVGKKYPGLRYFEFYDQIKMDLKKTLNIPVDLTDIRSLRQIGQKHILSEVFYVS